MCPADEVLPSREVLADRPGEEQTEPEVPERVRGRVDLSGATLSERYQLDRRIGQGGMGDVYLAHHATIDKRLAVKVLSPALQTSQQSVDRFLREARAASRIEHEHVVHITDFGSTPEGLVFFVMEFLAGEDLGSVIRREGRLPWPRVRDLTLQILDALGAAHDSGVIHRDMKPANCFVTRRGDDTDFIKVVDFGIAKVCDSGDPELTGTGVVLGSANYMSPEQAQTDELDHRSDLYSVGVMLFRMLTGKPPFSAASTLGVLSQHLTKEPDRPSVRCPAAGISPAMDAVVLRAMAKKPADRFATVKDFAAAIRAIDGPATARRSRSLGPLLAGVGIAAVALGLWATRGKDDSIVFEPGPAGAGHGAATARPTDTAASPAAALPASPATEKSPAEASSEPSGEQDGEVNALAPADDVAQEAPAKRRAADIERALRSVRSRVSRCGHEDGLFKEEPISIEMTLTPAGEPRNVEVKGASERLRRCVEKALTRGKFGPARRKQHVVHVFRV